jgi:hypothetical protein
LKKNSQIVAYIALGLVLLILLAGVALKFSLMSKEFKSKPKEETKKSTDPRTDVVYIVKRCLIKETEKALYLAAKQGGTLNISKWKNNGKFIYWFYWNDTIPLNKSGSLKFKENNSFYYYSLFVEKIPSLEELSKEMSNYLIKKVDECINGFRVVRDKYNIFVSYQIYNITVTFFNKSVKIRANIPITIYDPKSNKIDKRNDEFIEEVKIPYKRDYLKLKELLEKVFAQGLYGYYYILMSGTTDKIPYGILKHNCEKIIIDINEIKKAIEFILNKKHDICYSNCKYLYNPYNSFDSDIKIYLPDYLKTITDFYSIKYFDVYLNYDVKDPNKRYYLKNSKVEKDKIIIKGEDPEEYYHLDDMEFKLGKICSLTLYYDLIMNGSLTLVDNSLRNPLVFNIMFDFGLLNNRPVTLATYKQPKKSLQFYYINESSKEYYLWPRRAETAFFRDPRLNIDFRFNYNLDFEPVNLNQIKDKFIEFKGIRSYSFCYPFFVFKYKDKIPLLTICSDGTVAIKNKTSFIVLTKKDFIKEGFYNKGEYLPKSVVVSGTITPLKFKEKLIKNIANKNNYTFSMIPINKQIIDIFNNETLINNKFLEIREHSLFKTLLSLKKYNPQNEKISLEEENYLSWNSTDFNKEAFLLKNKDFDFLYLYGSVFSFLNISSISNKFKNNFEILNYSDLLTYDVTVIPISAFGNTIRFKKVDKNLVFPVIYNYYYIIRLNSTKNVKNTGSEKTQEDKDYLLAKLNSYLYVLLNLLIAEFQKEEHENKFYYHTSLYNSLIKQFSFYNKYINNLNFTERFKEYIKNGYNKNDFKINLKEEFGEDIVNYLIRRINEIEKICLEKHKDIYFYKNKEIFWNCLKEGIPEIVGFDLYASLMVNNFLYTNNLTILNKKVQLTKNPIDINFDDIMNCIKRTKDVNKCNKYFENKETKLNLDKETYTTILANPIYFMRQKDLINGTKLVKPFFGKDFEYKGRIENEINNYLKKLLDFKGILITKALCNTDNGKVEVYYSNYGLNKWDFKTKIPIGLCFFTTKFIYSYLDIKKNKKFKIIVDTNTTIPDVYKNYLKELAKFLNVEYKEKKNPFEEIKKEALQRTVLGIEICNYSRLNNNYLILTNEDKGLFKSLRSCVGISEEPKVLVLNLGETLEGLSPISPYGIYPISKNENLFVKELLWNLDTFNFIKIKRIFNKTISNKYSNFNIKINEKLSIKIN